MESIFSSTKEEQDLTGTLLGGYRLDTFIGSGGAGAVYRATHVVLERTAAVKVIEADCTKSCLAQLIREAQLAKLLLHDGIVQTLAFGESEHGSFYIAREWIDGQSLSALVDGRPLAQASVEPFFAQIFEAIKYAHSQGVVHRDLKPDNIMIEHDSQKVKLIDFGIARIVQDKSEEHSSQQPTRSSSGGLCGSPLYMSPEQCRGEKGDFRSDVYSLAVVIYQCLSGTTPFNGESPYEVMYKHLHAAPPPLVSEHPLVALMSPVVMKCLEKDPERRIQTVAEFESRLLGVLSVPELTTNTSVRSGKKMLLALLVFSLIGAGVALAATVLSRKGEETSINASPGSASKELVPRNPAKFLKRAISPELSIAERQRQLRMVIESPSVDRDYKPVAELLSLQIDLDVPGGQGQDWLRRKFESTMNQIGQIQSRQGSLPRQMTIVALMATSDLLLDNDSADEALCSDNKALELAELECESLDHSADGPMAGRKTLAISYNHIGALYYRLGHYREAEKWQRKALSLWSDLKTPAGASVASGLAKTLEVTGHEDQAATLFREAVAVLDEFVDANDQRSLDLSVAAMFWQRHGDTKLGLSLMERAIEKAGKPDQYKKNRTPLILANQARSALQSGDVRLARQLLVRRKQYSTDKQATVIAGELWAAVLSAELILIDGNVAEAKHSFEALLGSCRRAQLQHRSFVVRPEQVPILWALGDISSRLKDDSAAMTYYAEALPLTCGEDYIDDKVMLARIANYATLCRERKAMDLPDALIR